jgi:hypothetical protein
MAIERTLSILKPDATRRNLTGHINAIFEDAGLAVLAQKRILLTRAQAESFYGVHRERGFFNDLVSYMISVAAFSALSEPCTEFASMLSAYWARMVPSAAFFGSVAPISSRFFRTASSPLRTCATTGPEIM